MFNIKEAGAAQPGTGRSRVATRRWKVWLAVPGWTGLRPSKVNSGAWAPAAPARTRRAACLLTSAAIRGPCGTRRLLPRLAPQRRLQARKRRTYPRQLLEPETVVDQPLDAVRYELADLEEVEAERLDLSQYAVQCRPIQEAGEDGLCAVPLRHHRRERGQHRGAEVPVDPDRVQGGCWVHAAMVTGGLVNPHRRDLVTSLLTRAAGR